MGPGVMLEGTRKAFIFSAMCCSSPAGFFMCACVCWSFVLWTSDAIVDALFSGFCCRGDVVPMKDFSNTQPCERPETGGREWTDDDIVIAARTSAQQKHVPALHFLASLPLLMSFHSYGLHRLALLLPLQRQGVDPTNLGPILPREAVLDRMDTHTKDCSACSKAFRGIIAFCCWRRFERCLLVCRRS